MWIDHFRGRNRTLGSLLLDEQVATHPFVIGELACGNLANRSEILEHLARLPSLPVAEHQEALAFVEAHGLMGLGIGWIDVHLLSAAALGRAGVWTLDPRLARVAKRLRLAALV